MKRNIIILFFVICILQCSICPYASDNMAVLTSYNVGEASVTVSGVSYGKTVVTVMPYGMTVDDLKDTDVPSYFMRMFVSGGNYKCVIGIPEDAPGGRYTILVSSASGKAESQFIHVNSTEALDIVQLINEAYNDPESVKNIVEENALSLGIDDTDNVFKNNIEQIAKMLASKVYNDVTEFHDAYSLIHSIVSITSASSDTIVTVMNSSKQILGIDYNNYIDSDDRLDESAKSTLLQYISEYDFISDYIAGSDFNFESVCDSLKSFAAVTSAKRWSTLRKTVTVDFADDFNNLLLNSTYKKLNDDYEVFKILIEKTFTSPEDFEDQFIIAVKKAYDNENSQKKSSSSSKGSSGGGFSAPIVREPIDETKSETIHENNSVSNQPTEIFTDITPDFWGYKAVMSLADKGVINGYGNGSFYPSKQITRAEFAKIITAFISDIPGSTVPAAFSDVAKDKWYHDCVTKAAAAGVVTGYNGTFNPDDFIKREDAALMVYRIISFTNKNMSVSPCFADSSDISEYARNAVNSLGNMQILNGDGNNMSAPQKTITRAEAAQLLYNAFVK